jgi:acyl-CoA thioesterase-1
MIWLLGSAAVVAPQPDYDRRLSAVAAAAAGIVTILVVARLTVDAGRRYVRSTIGTVVAVSLTSNWMLWHLHATSSNFAIAGLVERIVLPLLVVLLAPLAAAAVLGREELRPRTLWRHRAAVLRAADPMDWIVVAYASVVLLPALLVGLAHHDRPLYVAQDLGLIVFFSFMYLAGRLSTADAAQASAGEITGLLLLLAASDTMLFHWQIAPLYSFTEAACAGALALFVLRRRANQLAPVGLAILLLAGDAVQIKNGTGASAAVEFAGALGIVGYLVVRRFRLVPLWILVPAAVLALAVFVGFTSDGAALRGVYHGPDPSNTGRTFEAHQVREAVAHSPVSLVFGRGLGSTIDERHAALQFRQTLVYGGRDLAHVQQIHLMGFSFLLKTGFLGLVWLAAFGAALGLLVVSGLERAARERDAGLVLYVALPLLGFAQALAATTHLQANPLNALGLGLLVTCLGAPRASAPPVPGRRRRIVAVAVCTVVAAAIVVYAGASRTTAQPVAAPTPVSLWIGDSYTVGAGAKSAATGEAFGVSAALGWQVELDAKGGTGFVAGYPKSRHDKPVPARLPRDARKYPASVVVVDAGRNDAGRPWPKVRRAAASYFSALAKAYPSSAIVVIAPWEMKSKPSSFLRLRQFLARQARRRHWAFVDPIADGWVNRVSAKLVTRDGVHPNQQGYNYIVSHLDLAIEKALAAAHETVRITCTEAAPCRERAPRSR